MNLFLNHLSFSIHFNTNARISRSFEVAPCYWNTCKTFYRVFKITLVLGIHSTFQNFTKRQHAVSCYSMLRQHAVARYSMLQHAVVLKIIISQHAAACYEIMKQHAVVSCSMLQHAIACYSVLQHATACCQNNDYLKSRCPPIRSMFFSA